MPKPKFPKILIAFLLFTGICFRLSLYLISTPNTFYDDHMQVIHKYAQSFERPAPSGCWECYHPPAYYVIGAAAFKLTEFAGLAPRSSWKMVQLINPILSIFVLILFYLILSEIGINDKYKALYLSFMVVLPRDIFTSAMIANDYLLAFCSVAALFYFIRCAKKIETAAEKQLFNNFCMLSLFTAIGCLTKQHGVLLMLLPASICGFYLFKEKRFALLRLAPVLLLVIAISFSEFLWQYKQTGKFLVSNLDYFPEAVSDQFPGSLDKVEFFSFKAVALFRHPYLATTTAASLPTELFARTFFDYEWKFLPPYIPQARDVGRLGYVLGLIWVLYFIVTTIGWLRKKFRTGISMQRNTLLFLVPLILALLFAATPVIQTIRFPYYSAMKAMYMLPGIIILLAMHALLMKNNKGPSNYYLWLAGFNVIYGAILILAIYFYFEYSPYWYFPK